MAGRRKAIELAMSEEDLAALRAIARSRTEPASRAERARMLMTNSGKYAHYGPGLPGRSVRFGSLADCAEAAVTGKVAKKLPVWLSG